MTPTRQNFSPHTLKRVDAIPGRQVGDVEIQNEENCERELRRRLELQIFSDLLSLTFYY